MLLKLTGVSMIKRLLILFSLVFMTGHLFAQFTTTSGTITDGDGTVWFNANVTATFVPNPNYPNQNQYNINGVNLTSPTYVSYLSQSTLTNGTGIFSLTLLDNNQIAPGGTYNSKLYICAFEYISQSSCFWGNVQCYLFYIIQYN